MIIIFFIFGVVIGSFLNVCIYRLPKSMSIINPPSKCFSCGHRLGFLDMIPILSYIIYKGRCRYCNAPYSMQYPVVEIASGFLYVFVYYIYGLNFNSIIYLTIISVLIVVGMIDLSHKIIPDSLNVTLVLIGVVLIFIDKSTFIDRTIGFGVGFGIFYSIAITTNAMGGGDIKLMAALGLIFGWKAILFIALFSFLIGSSISLFLILTKKKNRKDEIPFGQFIALSAFLYIFYGIEIINWYLSSIIII